MSGAPPAIGLRGQLLTDPPHRLDKHHTEISRSRLAQQARTPPPEYFRRQAASGSHSDPT